jgi:hypothetical protein
MDTEYEHVVPSRNHLVQRFRATAEPPTENGVILSGKSTPNHVNLRSEQGTQFSLHREPQSTHSDLETSTQTLKNLLSIKSTPSHPSTPPFPAMSGPPSPSPIYHSRTRSAAQAIPHKTLPTNSTVQPSRRVFSTSGVPPPIINHHRTYTESILSPDQEIVASEDRNAKMEKELRKVLNLS